MLKEQYQKMLKSIMHDQLGKARERMNMSQVEFSEMLMIDPRSYLELEHGNNLCSTLVFVLFAIYCCDDADALLAEIKDGFEQLKGA